MAATGSQVIRVAIVATITTILPGFLVGALSVQIRDEFGVSRAVYGWGLGSFFLAATLGSAVLGNVAQRVGPRNQVVAAQLASLVASVIIATAARSFVLFAVALALAGLANSANQSAVNLLLSRAELPRLGLAIALKQSGMPVAALLGGLAVPAIAVTVGWRWAYVVCAVCAAGSALIVRQRIEPVRVQASSASTQPVTPRKSLMVASVGFGCMAYAAGALNAWLVSSAHDVSGIAEGPAGLLLSLGASTGVGVRLIIGTRLDSSAAPPLRMAALMSSLGGVGIALLSFGSAQITLGATVVAFGCGWVWPVFTNFGVVRANREAAASASGVTQTGVYLGVFSGPLLSGFLIERFDYRAMWLVTAVVMLIGAAVTASASPAFDTPPRNRSREPAG